jgi:hypothetical protein
MRMGPHNGAINTMDLPIHVAGGIGLLLECVKYTLENAGFLPAVEAARLDAPRAIALGQIAPGGPGAQNPQQAIEDAAMVAGWPSRLRFLAWEQWL